MERLWHKIKPEKVLSVKIDPKKEKNLYCLVGGITHLGGANSGHYLSILSVSGVWYEINDARVKEITDTEALQSLENNGVLLLYKRSSRSKKGSLVNGKGSGGEVPPRGNAQASQTSHKSENETRGPAPGERRQRFPQPKGTKKAFRPKRSQGRKPEVFKGYYDPDKKCYYIPKIQS